MVDVGIIGLFIVFGFILMAVELFLVPGFSIPGLMGLGLIGYGIYRSFALYGLTGAAIAVIVSTVAAVVIIRFALKNKTIQKVALVGTLIDSRGTEDYTHLLGKDGVTASDLRPSGIARIDGERYTVVTDGEWVDSDQTITVVEVEGTRIVVQQS